MALLGGLRAQLADRARGILPEGRALSDELWERRHRGLVVLIWAHVGGLLLFGLIRGYPLGHVLIDVVPLGAVAAAAGSSVATRRVRSSLAALGLVASSAVLVHLSGGSIEAHFHFFVMVGLLSLYQEWMPFLLAIAFVVLHHGVLGAIMPREVYSHQAAISHPWTWALIHGVFVVAASVANLLAWRLNEHQSLHDGLTGLPNRVLLTDRIEHALDRRDGNRLIGVLFLDVDGFKSVNDTLGHAAGDALLSELSRRLMGAIRTGDTCARLGGDEFAILLDGLDNSAAALHAADRILELLAEPFDLSGRRVNVSASIGVALCVAGGANADDALRNADMAMYSAKRHGKARVEIYEPAMHAALLRQVELENDLKVALDEHQFVIHYQPIVDLKTTAVEGFEALLRWDHPRRGLVSPADFIPRAEETGLIVPLGAWVLEQAAAQLARWQWAHPERVVQMSVNLSARQLLDEGLVGIVSSVLQETGIDPSCLTLEITESTLMMDSWQNVTRLESLHALGVKLAIDDFGTGYSALSYLRRFRVDVLKVDKSFVDELLRGPEDQALAAAVVTMARAVHMRTVAEGIESAGQLATLQALGCDAGQGYYFSRPLSAEAAGELLMAERMVLQPRTRPQPVEQRSA